MSCQIFFNFFLSYFRSFSTPSLRIIHLFLPQLLRLLFHFHLLLLLFQLHLLLYHFHNLFLFFHPHLLQPGSFRPTSTLPFCKFLYVLLDQCLRPLFHFYSSPSITTSFYQVFLDLRCLFLYQLLRLHIHLRILLYLFHLLLRISLPFHSSSIITSSNQLFLGLPPHFPYLNFSTVGNYILSFPVSILYYFSVISTIY